MKIEIGGGGLGSTLAMVMVVGFFIPVLWVVLGVVFFLMWIAGLCADAQVKQMLKADAKSKLEIRISEDQVPVAANPPETNLPNTGTLSVVKTFNVEAPPPVRVLNEEQKGEIIDAAIAEAKRRLGRLPYYDHESRKQIFEAIVMRLCAREGVKVEKVNWTRATA